MGDNYKNKQNQPQATPLWTAEKQIMESESADKSTAADKKAAQKNKRYNKKQKPKKSFNKLLLVIPLCLALVAGIVLCAYFAFFSGNGDDDTVVSTDSSADSSEALEGKGFNWMLENGILTITGIGPMPNFTIESPAPWSNAGEITAIVISNGITSIGDFAFYECEDITSVTIPGTVITIGKGAFEDCNSLQSITVPEGVTSIDDGAFAGSGLTSVTIPSTVTDMGSDLFNHCAELISIVYNGTKEQWDAIEKDDTWQGNAPIRTVHCNDTVFDPQNPDAVLEYDAEGTTDNGLKWTLLDGTLTISGEGKMDGYTEYSNQPWYPHLSQINSVVINNGVTSIGDYAFYKSTSLTSVTIPNSVTSIGGYAFSNCTSLASISIPNSVTSLGTRAFYDCTSLTSVTIPNSVTSIVDGAFCNCTSLASISIPNSVTSIGGGAFAFCGSLASVTVGGSVTSIEDNAFSNCTSLTSVNYIGTKAQWQNIMLGYMWNGGAPFTVIHCTDGDVDLNGGDADTAYDKQGSSGDISWTLKGGVFTVSGKGNMPVSDIDAFDISVWTDCKSDIETLIIENGVTNIGDTSFAFCKKLKSVSIPHSVTDIDQLAFAYCTALKEISIPTSVKYISPRVFEDCTALTKVNYNGTVAQWKLISLSSEWNSGASFTVVHCTDGDVAV